jgi:hypothetical protein
MGGGGPEILTYAPVTIHNCIHTIFFIYFSFLKSNDYDIEALQTKLCET